MPATDRGRAVSIYKHQDSYFALRVASSEEAYGSEVDPDDPSNIMVFEVFNPERPKAYMEAWLERQDVAALVGQLQSWLARTEPRP
jgi:hypothetical protein